MEKLNHYNKSEVIDKFEINRIFDCMQLNDWLTTPTGELRASQQEFLGEARQHLAQKWGDWNEEELKMNFISIVFFVAQVDEPKRISTYYERKFAGEVNDIAISLVVDCMLASPTYSGQPKFPYFFLQEFKQSLSDGHDPEGQMLAAMILAQEFNKDGKPLYGCWVQGRFWYFTILSEKDYCVSEPFNATNADDLLQIVFILRKLKELILGRFPAGTHKIGGTMSL